MDADLAIFKACSDATRLRILFLLAERELCVCELVAVLEMAQGKISRHLAVLKQADLVNDRRDGTWIFYSLRAPDSNLKKRLHSYLVSEAGHQPQIVVDRNQVRQLAAAGQICTPHARHALQVTDCAEQ